MAPSPAPVDISRIDKYAPAVLIGREAELQLLTDAWNQAVGSDKNRPRVVVFVALGGEGKTALVAKWAANLSGQNWPDCDACFAWSFYSQGSDEKAATSSDLFLKEALTTFGDIDDKAFAASSAGAYEKGQRLARVVGAQRILLILDGLEPLQYAPTAPTGSELKDQGIAALLKGLATDSRGLCIVTTRYSVPNLKAFWQSSVREQPLLRLSRSAGVRLLKSLGVRGSDRRKIAFGAGQEKGSEFEKLVEDVKGHALTLTLLGSYLAEFHAGDIRQRDRVKLDDANDEAGGHAFRVMDAYVESFETGGHNEAENTKGKRALALLRLLGLFDRPATADCLHALWKPPAIPGLTDLLVEVEDKHRTSALSRLDLAKLLTVNRNAAGVLVLLDAHPHLREYFAKQLREQQPDAWRAGHKRLYEHLCATTKEGKKPTFEALQPLYQAVAHGCLAGLENETWEDVYVARIRQGEKKFSAHELGAFGSDLRALACFFKELWGLVSTALKQAYQAQILNEAAFTLRALGRLNDARDLMNVLDKAIKQQPLAQKIDYACNLLELRLILGEKILSKYKLKQYLSDKIIINVFNAIYNHNSGNIKRAKYYFNKTKRFYDNINSINLRILPMHIFLYCDHLLSHCECIAWQMTMKMSDQVTSNYNLEYVYQEISNILELSTSDFGRLGTALCKIIKCRRALYNNIIKDNLDKSIYNNINEAIVWLISSNDQPYLIFGLLIRACFYALTGAPTGQESAKADLDEAWEIAKDGPMPLFQADIHLYRARLFCRETPYPWTSPQHDLTEARKLIEKCGYWRRKEELEDAEEAAKSWPEPSPRAAQLAECPQTPVGKAETITSPTPVPQPPTNMRQEILALFKKLKPHQLDELVFLLEVPIHQDPSAALDFEHKKNELLKWALGPPPQLDNLLKELRELVGVSPTNPR